MKNISRFTSAEMPQKNQGVISRIALRLQSKFGEKLLRQCEGGIEFSCTAKGGKQFVQAEIYNQPGDTVSTLITILDDSESSIDALEEDMRKKILDELEHNPALNKEKTFRPEFLG